MATVEFALVAISSIVAVMNPLSTTAIFLTLTKGQSHEKNRQIAAKAAKLGFIILASFALTGTLIFQIFNIDLFSFQIAGGILLITIALKMLSEKNGFSSDKREDPSIIPLTFPLTAGPGTITTVILIFSQASSFFETIFVFVAIAVGVLLSYGGMIHAHRLLKIFGTDGTHVVSALMSIIVLAIAIQFVFAGIVAAVCQLTF
ncbi:MAG: MarC family protein [Candidatus Bathyarchaeota archaeon]|nr:MarC family protein [Candidatus Bathyarchaeum tardum]WGM90142.1 MAG: MarC family protein [Candidatus Bathyarchaeum tardum]